MKINSFNLIILIFIIPVQFSFAQKQEINSRADLPVIFFFNYALNSHELTKIDSWIKNSAERELIFTDSIFINYNIKDSRINDELKKRKTMCNFITGKWNDLIVSDTADSDYSVLSAYAKVQLQNISGIYKNNLSDNDMFIRYLKAGLINLSRKETENYLGSLVSRTAKADFNFDKELRKLSDQQIIADTSLFRLYQSYVFMKLGYGIAQQIESILLKDIADNFNGSDSARGTLSPERAWWNVLRYDITITPDYESKSVTGVNEIKYKVIEKEHPLILQIDLQKPMKIDSVFLNRYKTDFKNNGDAWFIPVRAQKLSSENNLKIYFHGIPHEAKYPPWDGGWIWKKDSLGNPWMTVACQGIGASVWYPCKEHQSDEPDEGASLTMIVPAELTAVSNGRLVSKNLINDTTVSFKWEVVNPINNYNIIPYIGKYTFVKDIYSGEKGKLDLDFWVMDYNLERAKNHMIPEAKRMLKAFEYWMGPYPFYEDGYKLIEAPHAGMEHQSAIAYGNKFQNGFWGIDASGSGWGKKWDYILVHESGHEWFGNNITSKDIADMWIQEGFTTYSEVLFTEYWYGKKASEEYNAGIRGIIQNNYPLIGFYGVNDALDSRSSDMYQKGANLIHTIRMSIDDDARFREILRGLNKTFYHKTVTSAQIENYISELAGFDYSKVFDQYLRTVQIPVFEFYFSKDRKKVYYRYTNCIKGFDLPLVLKDKKNKNNKINIYPSQNTEEQEISPEEASLFDELSIEKCYYINAREIKRTLSEFRNK